MKKLFLTALILFASPAFAQEVSNAIPLTKGETMLNISATENLVLKQDLLQASLRIEVDGKDAKKVQDDINKAMAKALATAKDVKEVKTNTGNYNVYSFDPNPQPLTKGEKRVMQWKGSQTIELESKDQAKLLGLAGKIQDMGFVMNNLNYTLSPEQSEMYRDNLMTAALKKIQTKAGIAAKALGKNNFDIVEVNVDGAQPIQPMPVMYARKMEMASDSVAVAAPVAQAGEQTISLSVTARVLLKP